MKKKECFTFDLRDIMRKRSVSPEDFFPMLQKDYQHLMLELVDERKYSSATQKCPASKLEISLYHFSDEKTKVKITFPNSCSHEGRKSEYENEKLEMEKSSILLHSYLNKHS